MPSRNLYMKSLHSLPTCVSHDVPHSYAWGAFYVANAKSHRHSLCHQEAVAFGSTNNDRRSSYMPSISRLLSAVACIVHIWLTSSPQTCMARTYAFGSFPRALKYAVVLVAVAWKLWRGGLATQSLQNKAISEFETRLWVKVLNLRPLQKNKFNLRINI